MNTGRITQVGSVSTHLPVLKNGLLLREFLIVVFEGRVLQIYNIISMKLIMEVEYEPGGKALKKGEEPLSIEFQTDAYNQYMLVTLFRGKNV